MDESNLVLSEWQFGRFDIRRVTEMVAPTPTEQVLETATDQPPTLELSIHTFVLFTEGSTVLVDTCVGNCREIPGIPDLTLETDFLDRLKAAGVDRSGVDVVINTHLHFDHVGWNTMLVDGQWIPTFPNARYLVPEPELAFWQGVDPTQAGPYGASFRDATEPLQDAGLLQTFAWSESLPFGLRPMPTPGHTPGHTSILGPAGDSPFVVTGDVLHNAWQFASPDTKCFVDVDAVEAVRTRRDFAQRCASESLVVLGTHFASSPVGRVQAGTTGQFAFVPIDSE